MFKRRLLFLLGLCFILIATPTAVVADRPEGTGVVIWDLTVPNPSHPANLYIESIDKWGAPFLFIISKPSAPAFDSFTVDIYKEGVIHQEDVYVTPQTDRPNTYTVFIEEMPYPGDGIITYSIVVKFRGKTLSEDVTIIFDRDS